MTERYPFFFTWTAQGAAKPVHLTGGEGAWFTTSDGERWLDLGALIYQVNVGHGHRRMIDAVRAQAERLCVALPGAVYPEKIELAERLLALAPPSFRKGRVFFTLGGSDANENAIKIARLFTGRYKLLSRYRSYHGATMGAVSLSGDWRRPPVEPGLVGVVHVDDLDPRAHDGPITHIPRVLELEGRGTVAAVFLESVVGGNGVLIPPRGYLSQVRAACDEHGTLLVMDEVLSGFGRTGKWFAFEHQDGVEPDMITLGKALTSGYGTLGAVLVSERVASFFDDHTLFAGLTSYAHPLGVAAGLEALRVYEEEGLVERAAAMESPLLAALRDLQEKHVGPVCGLRAIGLLAAIELDLDPPGWKRLAEALRKRRVHAHVQQRAKCIILSPPLCIGEDELREGIDHIDRAIAEAGK